MTKHWALSKTVWLGVLTSIVGVLSMLDPSQFSGLASPKVLSALGVLIVLARAVKSNLTTGKQN